MKTGVIQVEHRSVYTRTHVCMTLELHVWCMHNTVYVAGLVALLIVWPYTQEIAAPNIGSR